MPWGDGTGPFGMGPMTGRGAGFCAGYSVPGYANPGAGRGWWRHGWRGRGWWHRGRGGYGWRWRFRIPGFSGWFRSAEVVPPPAPLSSQEELDLLKREAEYLREELAEIEKEIEILERVNPEGSKK